MQPRNLLKYILAMVVIASDSLMGGCSARPIAKAEQPVVWRASVENGDKPGIGYELMDYGDTLRGSLYVLEPSRPNDFKSGMKIPLVITKLSEGKYRARAKLAGENEEIEIRFVEAENPETKKAIVQQVGDYSPEEFVFHRQ